MKDIGIWLFDRLLDLTWLGFLCTLGEDGQCGLNTYLMIVHSLVCSSTFRLFNKLMVYL